MWIIYTVSIILLLLFIMLFVFPIKIEIKHEIVPTFNKLKKYKSETVKEKHYLKIKLLWFILVYKKDLNKKKMMIKNYIKMFLMILLKWL